MKRVRGPGGCVAVSVALEGPRGREAGWEEATASPALATELLRGEGRKTTGEGGLGWPTGLARWAAVSQVRFSFSLFLFFVFVFYFVSLFWFSNNAKPFHKILKIIMGAS